MYVYVHAYSYMYAHVHICIKSHKCLYRYIRRTYLQDILIRARHCHLIDLCEHTCNIARALSHTHKRKQICIYEYYIYIYIIRIYRAHFIENGHHLMDLQYVSTKEPYIPQKSPIFLKRAPYSTKDLTSDRLWG